MSKIIAVFGSAKLDMQDPVLADSIAIGRALALAGFTVITGGYGGVMGAASKGAYDAGGHVIGVTAPGVKMVRETEVNPWVKEEIQCTTFRERLNLLVEKSDGYVVMPGGVGTLQELVEVWQLRRINQISSRPLVCYGNFWRDTVETLVQSPYVPSEHGKMVQFAETHETVLSVIQHWEK